MTSPLAAQQQSAKRDTAAHADTPPKMVAPAQASSRILGVFDEETGNPIVGADVIDLFTDGQAHTEAHGLVELSRFQRRNDSAVVRIRKLGYADTSLIVLVGPADTVPIQVNLRRAAVDLPGLIAHAAPIAPPASPLLGDFDARRKMGFGHFIDGAELRSKVDNHSFINYLATSFPGMSIIRQRDNSEYLSSGRGQCSGRAFKCGAVSTQCPIALYIDDVPTYVPGLIGDQPDLASYKSDDFVAVEWYSSGATVPMRYGGTGSQCGVLLLWRRYR